MYAVVVTGGKQYKAQVGQTLTIEKLDVATGQDVEFDQVLMISDGAEVTVGTPTVTGATTPRCSWSTSRPAPCPMSPNIRPYISRKLTATRMVGWLPFRAVSTGRSDC